MNTRDPKRYLDLNPFLIWNVEEQLINSTIFIQKKCFLHYVWILITLHHI